MEYIKEDILTCPICMEIFDIPKMLPCQHTFCQKCITSHVSGKGKRRSNKHCVCPICRREVKLDKDLDDDSCFQSNIAILYMLNAIKKEEEGQHECVTNEPDVEVACSIHEVFPVTAVCLDHHCLVCVQCKYPNTSVDTENEQAINHGECLTMEISKYLHSSQYEQKLENLLMIDDMVDTNNTTVKELELNKLRLDNDKDIAVHKMEAYRKSLCSEVLALERNVDNEIMATHQEVSQILTKRIKECKVANRQLKNIQRLSFSEGSETQKLKDVLTAHNKFQILKKENPCDLSMSTLKSHSIKLAISADANSAISSVRGHIKVSHAINERKRKEYASKEVASMFGPQSTSFNGRNIEHILRNDMFVSTLSRSMIIYLLKSDRYGEKFVNACTLVILFVLCTWTIWAWHTVATVSHLLIILYLTSVHRHIDKEETNSYIKYALPINYVCVLSSLVTLFYIAVILFSYFSIVFEIDSSTTITRNHMNFTLINGTSFIDIFVERIASCLDASSKITEKTKNFLHIWQILHTSED